MVSVRVVVVSLAVVAVEASGGGGGGSSIQLFQSLRTRDKGSVASGSQSSFRDILAEDWVEDWEKEGEGTTVDFVVVVAGVLGWSMVRKSDTNDGTRTMGK